jgi:zinc transport system permease protein
MGHHTHSLVLLMFFAVAAGVVGSFALMKRMLLASDVLSHLALPGLGIALLFKINPLVGGALSLFMGTMFVWKLQKRSTLATETVIGVVFAAALALGALVTPHEDLMETLFGDFPEIGVNGFVFGVLAILAAVVFMILARERLALVVFSEDLAAVAGINVNRMNLYFLLAFSLTILVGLRFMGALLSSALIIVPAAAGRQLSNRLSRFLLYSSLVSMASVLLGLLTNTYLLRRSSPGPTIAIISTLLFGLSLLSKRNR